MDRGQSLEEAIRSEASRLGFAACGFTRAHAADAAGLELKRWLAAGHHGTMGWMEERAHHRVSPLALWPDARSAIALGMSYAPATDPMALAAHPEVVVYDRNLQNKEKKVDTSVAADMISDSYKLMDPKKDEIRDRVAAGVK